MAKQSRKVFEKMWCHKKVLTQFIKKCAILYFLGFTRQLLKKQLLRLSI